MPIMNNNLLRDLFQNNIDYVSKQVGRILDSLYGEQADENDPLPANSYFYHTIEYATAYDEYVMIDMRGDTQGAVYSVDITPEYIDIRGIAENPYYYSMYTTQTQHEQLQTQVMPYLASYEYHYTLSELGIDHFAQGGTYVRAYNNANEEIPVGITQPFGIDTNRTATINNFIIWNAGKQRMTVRESNNPYDPYRQVNYDNCGNVYGSTWVLNTIDDEYRNTNYIIMPSETSDSVYTIDNNFYDNTYNYSGDTIHNYYNDSGDIVINGGGVGLAPVVGLGYADLKLVLDSLVDELNIKFNFGSDGETLPLDYAPTWEELHYIDQGSFYITPIQQIDTLSLAPDVGDTVPYISDYLSIVGGAVTSFYNMVDDLGVGLMLVFTFLICLVINHLKKG